MTKSLSDSLDDAWGTLEYGRSSSDCAIDTLKLDIDVGNGPVRLALGEGGELRMLIPTHAARDVSSGLSGSGLGVRLVRYVVDGQTRPFIELSSRVRGLDSVFRSLTSDVLRRLQTGRGAEFSVAESVAEYRDLLRSERLLSKEVVVGLFGELLILELLLMRNASADAAWTGPFGHRHDFSAGMLSIEVKTALSRASRNVTVTSLEQLDSPADGRQLYLVHQVLERGGTGGRGLRELIDSVRARAPNHQHIDSALGRLGLADWRTSGSIDSERYALVSRTTYRVGGGFPRLTGQSFVPGAPPLGVMGIVYDIDLTHAAQFRLDDAGSELVLRDLAGMK